MPKQKTHKGAIKRGYKPKKKNKGKIAEKYIPRSEREKLKDEVDSEK